MVQRVHEHLKPNEPGIGLHCLRHSSSSFVLLNDANPTRVQKMMLLHQHYAITKIHVEEEQCLLDREEDAIAQI